MSDASRMGGDHEDRLRKNAAAIQLLEVWMSDDSGYDERVWPRVQRRMEANRLSSRTRFQEFYRGRSVGGDNQIFQEIGRVYFHRVYQPTGMESPWAAKCLQCDWYHRYDDITDGHVALNEHILRTHVPTYTDHNGVIRCVGGTQIRAKTTELPLSVSVWVSEREEERQR